jgi:ADP-heptose:LPS heptosyltransferase
MLSAQGPKVNRKKTQHGLVLFPGSLGDLICALPAIESILKQKNNCLTLAVRGEAFELAASLPFVATSCSLDGRAFSQLFSPYEQIPQGSRAFFAAFSEIISWYGHSHAEVVENLRTLSAGCVQSFPFFTGQKDCHAVAYYLRCVGEHLLQCPVLQLSEPERHWCDNYWRQRGWRASTRVLVMHPGSGGKKKRWDPEGFQKVARWWQEQRKGKVLLLLGPAEEQEIGQWRTVGEVAARLSVWQVAAIVSRADFYIGNDSGVSHLAGAVGARGVVLFGPTRPRQWRPLGGSLSVLQNFEYRRAFPTKEGISFDEMTDDEVIAKLTAQGG